MMASECVVNISSPYPDSASLTIHSKTSRPITFETIPIQNLPPTIEIPMEELSEKFQRFNPFTRKNFDCKWSLPATEEQLVHQGWNFQDENPQSPTILGEGGGGVVYKRELRLCRAECTKCSPVVCAVKRLDNTLFVQTAARLEREAQIMDALGKFSVRLLRLLVLYSQYNVFEPNILFWVEMA